MGEGGAGALCSGGWRMAPTPSIIWQPLALWLTRPLRPETECSISSEPSPPTSPSPSPPARLLWPQEWEQQLEWGDTQRCAQTQDTPAAQGHTGSHTETPGVTQGEGPSERLSGTRELVGSQGPSFHLFLLPAGIKQHVAQERIWGQERGAPGSCILRRN